VRQVEAGRAVLELVNLSPFETRDVIVQAGTFGEHLFTTVKHKVRTDPEPLQPDSFARAEFRFEEKSVPVNRKFFAVRLPPGTGLTLEAGMKRFTNQPTYAFPWHRGVIPVR